MIYYIMIGYVVVLSLVGLVLCGLDKHYARIRHRRISERTLFLVAALGGSVGVWVGMYLFRHKTRHPSFVLGIPAILLVQTVAIILLVYADII